jgi:large subunit ribosomal protein L13
MAKKGELNARWHLVDLTDKVLGRAAVRIARILMGKHHPEYTPHVDTGDFVVVINAEKVKLSGTKAHYREYQTYSRYPGGQKRVAIRDVIANHPERVLHEAVRRMLPKNKLAEAMISKLKIYAGPTHPHQAQQPQTLDL